MTAPAAGVETTVRPVALFVLGMGRSGTSALTRVLSLCGAALPEKLVGANAGNPTGHWEPRKATSINESILFRHGSGGWDPSLRLQEEGGFDAQEEAECIREIGAFLATLPSAPLVVIKELSITALWKMWFEAAHRAGFDIVTVIAVRHPQEVVASLATRDLSPPEFSSALWLKYSLLSERNTRAIPRVFVDYTNLLTDWRREITRISAKLGVNLEDRDENAIEEFLRPDLRRQRYHGPVIEPFGTDWLSTVYETMCIAARDESWNTSELDRVFESYRASERAFRIAFQEFRNSRNGLLRRPLLARLIRETVATIHLDKALTRPSVWNVARRLRRW